MAIGQSNRDQSLTCTERIPGTLSSLRCLSSEASLSSFYTILLFVVVLYQGRACFSQSYLPFLWLLSVRFPSLYLTVYHLLWHGRVLHDLATKSSGMRGTK